MLCGGNTPRGRNLNTQEKAEITRQLEKLAVDRIEAGFIDEVILHAKQPPRQDAADRIGDGRTSSSPSLDRREGFFVLELNIDGRASRKVARFIKI
ncbi:MAG: hypothetical protein K0Q94_2234 [Paenibacillus sp.]|nr:hypothetical protein [Paenibacillus sp.]